MSAKRERQPYQITLNTNSIKLPCTPPCVRSTCKPTVTDQLVHKPYQINWYTKQYQIRIYSNSIRSTCPPIVSDQLVYQNVSDQLVHQPYQPNLYTNSIRSVYTQTVTDLQHFVTSVTSETTLPKTTTKNCLVERRTDRRADNYIKVYPAESKAFGD